MHNDDLAQVSWEMGTEEGNPVWPGSQDVESVDYAHWAQLLGVRGIRLRADDAAGATLDEACEYPGVTLIDAYVSRTVPPLPPHITKEYAVNMAKALANGDPNEFEIIRDSSEALAAEGVARVKGALHLGRSDDD